MSDDDSLSSPKARRQGCLIIAGSLIGATLFTIAVTGLLAWRTAIIVTDEARRIGSTIDDAAGEAFDKIAKTMGLPYPGGPALERLAEGGDASRFTLPRMLLGRKDCDFSFSGLKTAAARLAEGVTTDDERRDLAAAVQTAIATQLAERSERAMQAFGTGRPRRKILCQ